MIVKNPTDSILSVQIKGNVYEIAPKGEISGVPAAAASHWQEQIHNFIVVESEARATPAPVKKEEVKEPAPEKATTVASPVSVKDAPKK